MMRNFFDGIKIHEGPKLSNLFMQFCNLQNHDMFLFLHHQVHASVARRVAWRGQCLQHWQSPACVGLVMRLWSRSDLDPRPRTVFLVCYSVCCGSAIVTIAMTLLLLLICRSAVVLSTC